MVKMLVDALLVLIAAVSTPLTQMPPSQESCVCLELERAIEGLSTMSSTDWTSVERARFEELWPTASASCEPIRDMLIAEAELYELCCSSCGTCGGQRLVEGIDSSIVSLRAMGALVCRDSRDEAMRDLDLLVEVTIPPNVVELYERLHENNSPIDMYRWGSRGESFLLTTAIIEWRQRWIGTLEVTRCEKRSGTQEWILDDGSAVEILDFTIDADDVDDRWLHLTYATRCGLATGSACVQSEMQRVWDRLRLETDLADVDIVALEAEDCRFKSYQTLLTKTEGTWPVSILR